MASEDYNLLIVSDLHLSEGRDAKTKKLSLIEDFLFDEEFARFLHYHMRQSSGRPDARTWRLIINGDFFDFLQVLSTEPDQEFLDYLKVATHEEPDATLGASPDRPGYGFGTGWKETVFKLWKIMDSHWLLFEALAEFIVAGNVVSIGRGNHDVELIYSQVRAAFMPKLRRIYEAKLMRERTSDTAQLLLRFDQACRADAISFLDWFYYENELWVEHGNQYDELNTFKYWLAPYLPGTDVHNQHHGEIDLPWGSLFVRYLFNKIETEEPFADNIKPTTQFIAWLLKSHPLLALHFMFHHGSYMAQKMARAWRSIPDGDYRTQEREHRAQLSRLAQRYQVPENILTELDQQRARNILKEPYRWWGFGGWLTRHWRMSMTVAASVLVILIAAALLIAYGVALPLIPGTLRFAVSHATAVISSVGPLVTLLRGVRLVIFVGLLVAFFVVLIRALPTGHPAEPCYLVEHANHIRDSLSVRYVVMGHTHDADLQPTAGNGEYFNTGTWTKVFSEREQLIRDENELVFLRGTRVGGHLEMKLMKWMDGAAEPRLVKLFSDKEPRQEQPAVTCERSEKHTEMAAH